MRRLLAIVALGAAAAAAGGCGTAPAPTSATRFKGDDQAVAQVVDELSTAGRRKDAGRICGTLVSASLAARLRASGSTCEDEVKKAIDDADDFDLIVRSVRVSGAQAQAQVAEGADGSVRTYTFAKEGGRWKVSALG